MEHVNIKLRENRKNSIKLQQKIINKPSQLRKEGVIKYQKECIDIYSNDLYNSFNTSLLTDIDEDIDIDIDIDIDVDEDIDEDEISYTTTNSYNINYLHTLQVKINEIEVELYKTIGSSPMDEYIDLVKKFNFFKELYKDLQEENIVMVK